MLLENFKVPIRSDEEPTRVRTDAEKEEIIFIEEKAPAFPFDSQTPKVVEAAEREHRSEHGKAP